jgi:hypothetical protein
LGKADCTSTDHIGNFGPKNIPMNFFHQAKTLLPQFAGKPENSKFLGLKILNKLELPSEFQSSFFYLSEFKKRLKSSLKARQILEWYSHSEG